MIVKWTKTALKNLDDLADYVAEENPRAAASMVRKVLTGVEKLKRFPALGKAGRVSGTRELLIVRTPYVVPYRVKGNRIQILRVFHSSRRWPDDF